MIPLRDQNPSFGAPAVLRVIVGLNIVFFLIELVQGPALREFVFAWGLVPARVTLALSGGPEPLALALGTFVTSMFLHGGWAHLIGNMWYLWIFGDNVEDRLGHGRFLVFYLGAGIAAAVLHWALHPGSTVPTVGASGAIAGVLGAYLRIFPHARVITLLPLFPVFPVVALPALVVLGLWFVLQFFSGALSLGMSTTGGGTAWWAHIGGFGVGVLLAPFLDRGPREIEPAPPEWR
jgi:membrane associated rhomboid family serine protease